MKKNKGFTLIELLVVIAIIGVLAAIIMVFLSGARGRSNDTKIQSQLKSMINQAQLFVGTTGTQYIVSGTLPTPSTITGAATGGTAASGTLFNDTTTTNGGLYALMSKLPSTTNLYYGWDGASPSTSGRWFVAASGSVGAFCIDSANKLKVYKGTAPTDVATFTAAGVFPNATSANGYSCN